MTCQKCGAEVAPGVPNCGYCAAPTSYSHQAAWQAQQLQHYQAQQRHDAAMHRDAARQQSAQASLERTARHALFWSLAGLFCCFIPIFGVVGVVMALRARKMAKKYQLVVPVLATLGLVIGVFSILLSGFVYVMIIVQEIRLSSRIDELQSKVGSQDTAQLLSPEVACYLAEIRVLKDGIGGRSRSSIEDVECHGRLESNAAGAVLHDFSLRVNNDSRRHFLKACFIRGQRWSVTGFRKSAGCDEADDTVGTFDSSSRHQDAGVPGASSAANQPGSPRSIPTPAPSEPSPGK